MKAPALMVVDMQRYYLEEESAFAQFHSHFEPECLDYICSRCARHVIPNISRLTKAFRDRALPIIYLRLCGVAEDRSDLQHTFYEVHQKAEQAGYPGLYPLASDPFSEVIPALSPQEHDAEFCKTTYSGFTSSPGFANFLSSSGIQTLIFTGLATSQCVETTARDAADRNYHIIHVDDAQADYSETSHRASLYSSQGVCGGQITDTETLLAQLCESRSAKLKQG